METAEQKTSDYTAAPQTATATPFALPTDDRKDDGGWDSFYAKFEQKQTMTRNMALDRDFFRFVRSPEARDDARLFAYLDDYTLNRFGVTAEKGNVWKPDRTPFANGRRYADALVSVITRGYSSIASDKWREWDAARRTGDRATMMKAAKIDPNRYVEDGIDMMATGSAAMNPHAVYFKKPVAKSDDEIDRELKAYNAEVESENFVGTVRAVAHDFDEDDRRLLSAAIRHGDGLPQELQADFEYLARNNREKASRLKFLVDLSRKNAPDGWRDAWTAFSDGFDRLGLWGWGDGTKHGLAAFVERKAEEVMSENGVIDVLGGMEKTPYYWNDEEKAEFRRLVDVVGLDEQNARTGVNVRCARRLADEMRPKAERERDRIAELLAEDAVKHRPYSGYSWYAQGAIDVAGTIPYMVSNAFGWPVFIANVLGQYENTRDEILLAGGDPDEAWGAQLALAAGWAGIEKLQMDGLFGKPLTSLGKRRLMQNWWNDKLNVKLIGQLASASGKEALATTFYESFQEGLQGIIEEGTKAYFTKRTDDGSVDWQAVRDSVGRGFWDNFTQSLASMGYLGLAGSAFKTAHSLRKGLDADSMTDYAARWMQAVNIVRGTTRDAAETVAAGDTAATGAGKPRIKELMAEAAEIFRNAPSALAATDEIARRFQLDEQQAMKVADALDLRENILANAARMSDEDAANYYAELAGNAFRVGNDTTYDVVDFLSLVNPEITVEEADVTDFDAPLPTEAQKAAVSAAEDRADSLRSEIARQRRRAEFSRNPKKRRVAESRIARLDEELAQAERDLADARDAAQPKKRRVRKVSVPFKTKDGTTVTKTYTVVNDVNGPNMKTTGYANSVANAMTPLVGRKGVDGNPIRNGEDIATSDFKMLPLDDKLNVAVTTDQWLAMSDQERNAYAATYGLKSGGNFRALDEQGREAFGTDGVMRIFRAFGTPNVGGNWTLGHEHNHAIVKFARELGLIKEGDPVVKTLRKLFGDPREGMDELWNEETMGDAFADYMRAKFDFRPLSRTERKAVKGLFSRMSDAVKGLFGIAGRDPIENLTEKGDREKALDAVFEAVRNGDFSGLDAFAGIEFDDDKNAGETDKGDDAAPDARKPPSKPPEEKPSNETPEPAKRAPAAPEPAPAQPLAASAEQAARDIVQNPVKVVASLPQRTGVRDYIYTPDYRMKVQYEWVWQEARDRKPAFGDFQPRVRTDRFATDKQIHDKTRPGVFKWEALVDSKLADDGAPIIVGGGLSLADLAPDEDVDGMTASGNGRDLMVLKLAEEGRYEAEYLNPVLQWAAQNGIPPPPDGMEHPMLKRRIVGGLKNRAELVQFCSKANHWSGLEMSASEDAAQDVRAITPALLRRFSPGRSGDLLAASNRDFMNAFLEAVGATGLTNADGTPNHFAALRAEQALMGAIFGNDDESRIIIKNLLEDARRLSLGNLRDALVGSAGKLLAMRERRGSFDIVADVREAASHYIAWRVARLSSPSLSLSDHLAQSDFFSEKTPALQQALARLLDVGRFGATLDRYSELVAQEAVDAQATFSFSEKKTNLQLLGEAERAILPLKDGIKEAKSDDDYKVQPVTPSPSSAEAAAPRQTPPAVAAKPEPPAAPQPEPQPEPDPVDVAQRVIAPPEPQTFVPTPVVRGSATLPGTGATGITAYQVDAEGNPTTRQKSLPPGAWNLLRPPYSVTAAIPTSEQDRTGRGLGISHPPPTDWNDIFPHFQGNKTEMADRTSQAIRNTMSKAEREHYTTVVDYFGGGGCWGLYHALVNFPNVRNLVINEWEPARLAKIRLLHEIDGEVAVRARSFLFDQRILEPLKAACRVGKDGRESGSGATISNKLMELIPTIAPDASAETLGMIYAFIDCGHTMLANVLDASGNPSTEAGINAILERLAEDGRKAKKAADAFKARGGRIAYRQGDAASFHDAPHGDRTVAVCDPPYYLTAGYNGQASVPLEGAGWSYRTTQKLLEGLVDSGDAIVYTDEAWWNKETYSPDRQTDFFNAAKSTFDREQETLLAIINTLDHFDVAGRVAGRQETLGIHHGHAIQTSDSAAGREVGDAARPPLSGQGPDGRGTQDDRPSVRRMAGGSRREDQAVLPDRAGRGRAGLRALATELIVRNISSSLEDALGRHVTPTEDAIVRHSVRQVRPDRIADFSRFAKKNAARFVAAAAEGRADPYDPPVPTEMRADTSLPDLRFSVQAMGRNAREEARKAIAKYRPNIHQFTTNVNGKTMPLDEAALQSIESDFTTPKERKAALYWFCKGTVRLPEDAPKIVDALKTSERAKVDPFQFSRPGDILEHFAAYIPNGRPIDPDKVPELSDRREMGHGIVTYLVQDDKAGQAAMRKIINTHFGKDASPWCLLQGDKVGNLTDDAWHYWNHYNALPKRVAFKDGKLVAFMATDQKDTPEADENGEFEPGLVEGYRNYMYRLEQSGNMELMANAMSVAEWGRENGFSVPTKTYEKWWDRTDAPHDGIPFTEKDGDRTLHQELASDGKVTTLRITKGDRKADGVYEEWDVNADAERRNAHIQIFRENGKVVRRMTFYKSGEKSSETIYQNGNDRTYESKYYMQDGRISNVQSANENGDSILCEFDDNNTPNKFDLTAGQVFESFQETWDDDGRVAIKVEFSHSGMNIYNERFFNPETGIEYRRNVADDRGEFHDERITDADRMYLPPITREMIEEKARQILRGGIVEPFSSLMKKAAVPRFSVRAADPAADAAYMDAVKRGDMETAQRMVREAAAKAMPDTKVVGEDGLPLIVYHGRGEKFNMFLQKMQGSATHGGAATEWGFFFAEDFEHAEYWARENFGENGFVDSFFLDIKNPAEIDVSENGGIYLSDDVNKVLEDSDFDGAHIIGANDTADGTPRNMWIAVNVEGTRYGDDAQIKSADPVTRDDDGNVIPLSQRFNPQNTDIRYSVIGRTGAANLGIGGLDEAERMERDGASVDRIWRTTGWWRGHDGKWRIDIDDESFAEEIAAALEYEWTDEDGKDGKPNVASIIAAKDLKSESLERLVKAYPQLSETTLSIEPDQFSLSGTGAKADYNPDTNEVRVFENAAFRNGGYDARAVAFEIVHEMQHAIQTLEGHPNGRKVARGGIMLLESAGERRKNIRDTITNYGEMEAYIAQRRHIAGPYERMTVPPWKMERMYLQSANRQFGFRLGQKDIRYSITSSFNPDARVVVVDGRNEPAFNNLEAKEIRDYLRDKYKGREVTIHSDGTVVEFTLGGLTSALKKRGKHRRALHRLDVLIENSHFTRYDGNDGKEKHKHLNGQFVYTAALRLKDGIYGVELKLDDPIVTDNAQFKGQTLKTKIADAVLSVGPRSKDPLPTSDYETSAVETVRLGDIASTPHIMPYSGADVKGPPFAFSPSERVTDSAPTGPRASVRAMRNPGNRLHDLVTALVAQRHLAGKDVKVEDVDRILRNVGLVGLNPAEFLARAKSAADANRAAVKDAVARNKPELTSMIARSGLQLDMQDALDNIVAGTAAAVNPDVGMKLQDAIHRKQARDLAAAKGFTADEMMAELPIDLAKAVFAVADYERTPEELARLEKQRKKREEQRRREDDDGEIDADEAEMDELSDAAYRQPTAAERRAIDELMDRAKASKELADEEKRRKDAQRNRKPEDPDESEDADDGTAAGDGSDAPASLPEDTVRRIAPVFETPDLFAAFIVEWCMDKIVLKHPELPTTGDLWKSPVAIRELKQTARSILSRLAKDCLGSPSINYARNIADKAINDLDRYKTYAAIRRKIANIYRGIHDDALTISRTKMVKALVRDIDRLADAKGRFATTAEEKDRKTLARVSQWARWVKNVLTMSEKRLQAEIDRLNEIVTPSPDSTRNYTPDQQQEAAERLVIANRYGGMIRMMPGQISDLAAEIKNQLESGREEFLRKQQAREEMCLALRKALTDAMANGAHAFRKPKGSIEKWADAYQGNIILELQNLVRFCRDENLRKAAMDAIDDLSAMINQGGSDYRNTLYAAQTEVNDILVSCYGNAERGIKHLLNETVPDNVAAKVFHQKTDGKRTFGCLLQLYASIIQSDYRDNAIAHGRMEQLKDIEAALTPQDRLFHAAIVDWYKRNRKVISDPVEAVTGLPVTSPDENYCPVRPDVKGARDGFNAKVVAWSPVPRALERRVRHGLDFNEDANFFAIVMEQAEIRAQTVGYAQLGTVLRDVIANHELREAARKSVGEADYEIVVDHLTDILAQDAERSDHTIAPLNFARRWVARFGIAWNVASALAQPASIPAWVNVTLGGRAVGYRRLAAYLTSVGSKEGREAIAELCASDGIRARYDMGWSEEIQNVLRNPSRNRALRSIEAIFDKGFVLSEIMDKVCSLWVAQGFYRDAKDHFLRRGLSLEDAKKKALALTSAAIEATQQTGRTEFMNRTQRKSRWARAIFQFRTAQLLTNNFIIQGIKDVAAGTPGAKGRLLRALATSMVIVPGYMMIKNALWSLSMGDEPPEEDPDKWPLWLREMLFASVDGVTAPLFVISSVANWSLKPLLDLRTYGRESGIPALDSFYRTSEHAFKAAYDAFDCFDVESEVTVDKLMDDLSRILKDVSAPYRHGSRLYDNRFGEDW